jgi:integrin beta 3
MDGVHSLEVKQTGRRTFEIATIKTSGVVTKTEAKLPIPLYENVFSEAHEYERGDMVTSGGSLWMALKDQPEGKPDGKSADWRLIVKRGRDGKDGAPGERGERGEKGDPGRDLTVLGPDGSKFR